MLKCQVCRASFERPPDLELWKAATTCPRPACASRPRPLWLRPEDAYQRLRRLRRAPRDEVIRSELLC